MNKLTLFPVINGKRFISFDLEDTRKGIEFLAFFLENLSRSVEEGLSLRIDDTEDNQFPTIHFQQIADEFFLQIYVSDKHNKLEEGWYCLVDGNYLKPNNELITTVWDEPEGDYFQARFSEGVLISKSLLISKITIEGFISKYLDNMEEWYDKANWLNVGII